MSNKVTYNATTGETQIQVDQGSTFEHTFTLTVNSQPFDLTGYDARMQVRKTYGSSTPVFDGTLSNGKLNIVSAVNGTLKVIMTPADSSVIKFNSTDDSTLDCVFDVEIQNILTGKVYKPVKGTLVFAREVTR